MNKKENDDCYVKVTSCITDFLPSENIINHSIYITCDSKETYEIFTDCLRSDLIRLGIMFNMNYYRSDKPLYSRELHKEFEITLTIKNANTVNYNLHKELMIYAEDVKNYRKCNIKASELEGVKLLFSNCN